MLMLHMTLLMRRPSHSSSSDGLYGLQELAVQFVFGQLMLKMCVAVEPDVAHYLQGWSGKNWGLKYYLL